MLTFRKASVDHVLPVSTRCLFCLSIVHDEQDSSVDWTKSVPRFWARFPVDEFQTVWRHLLGEVPDKEESFLFPETPPLCCTCGGWLKEISTVLNQLKVVTNQVKDAVKCAGKSGVNGNRIDELLREIQSAQVSNFTRVEALHLLEAIGFGPFQEEDLTKVLPNGDTKLEPVECKVEIDEDSQDDILLNSDEFLAGNQDDSDDEQVDNSEEEMESNESDAEGDGESSEVEKDNDEEDNVSDERVEEKSTRPSPRKKLRRDPPQRRSSPEPRSKSKPCDFCEEQVDLDNMLDHVRKHVGDYVIPCPNPKCKRAFSNPCALRSHAGKSKICQSSLKSDTNECHSCGLVEPRIYGLFAHLKAVHESDMKPFSCPVTGCNERFTLLQSVQCHIASHTASRLRRRKKPLFECEFCGRRYPDRRHFESHVRSKHAPTWFPCDIPGCHKSFATLESLNLHKENQIHPNPCQICDICREKVPLENILEHVTGHVGDYALVCPNPRCGQVYSNPSTLRRHCSRAKVCMKNLTKKANVCEICGHSAVNTFGLLAHLKAVHETDEKPFPCPVADCNERFTLRVSVQNHISYHTAPLCKSKRFGLGPYPCQFCDKKFPKLVLLNRHEKTHNVPKQKLFQCDIPGCDKRFTSLHGVKFHKSRESHADPENPHKCHHCNESFVILSKLQHHLALKHKEKVKVKKLPTGQKELVEPEKLMSRKRCPDCPDDETLRSYSTMRNHRIAMHGADPYKCAECGDQFQTADQFKIHRITHRAVKEEPKRFVCDVPGCGKVFKSNKNLSFHKSSIEHLGRTNAVVCGQCGKGFNYMDRLKAHEKLVHGTERKYVCDDCGESFKSGTVLKRHKLIHTGERPFQCDICQQRFRTREVLKKHVESHERKGASFRPNGPMKHVRRRVNPQ